MQTDFHFAIIVPCHNEEKSLPKLLLDLRDEFSEALIVVVDNASTDRTREVAMGMSHSLVLDEPKRGKSNALRLGLKKVEKDYAYVAIIDGDLTYSASDLRRIFDELVRSPQKAMVVGNRLHQGIGFQFSNFVFNKLVATLASFLFKKKVCDLLSGLRVWRSSNFKSQNIQSHGFEFETEMTLYHLKNGLSVSYLPIHYEGRIHGISKIKPFRDAMGIVREIVTAFFR